MADLSKLSTEDLIALKEGRYRDVSTEGLKSIVTNPANEDLRHVLSPNNPFEVAGKAANFTGGLVRGPIGLGVGALTGDELVKPSDILYGTVPSTKQMLEKSGVPNISASDVMPNAYAPHGKGQYPWSLEKGGMLDPSALGVAGLIGDIATDPMTYVAPGVGAKIGGKVGMNPTLSEALTRPISLGAEKTGEKLYKSGLKNIDSRVVEKGGNAPSQYMLDQGMFGGTKSLADQMDARLAELGNQRQGMYKTMEDKGITIDPKAASQEAYNVVNKLKENPYMAPKAQDYMDYLGLAQEPMAPAKASQVKTELYDSLPASAYDPNGKLTNVGQKVNRALGSGYKTELEKGAELAQPGMGPALSDTNEEMGAYLAAKKPTQSEIAKEARKNMITQVDAMLAGAGIPEALSLKQVAKIANATGPRTTVGFGLNRLGKDLPEGAWRNILLSPMRDDYKPEGQ
jgi:hypothetical protein